MPFYLRAVSLVGLCALTWAGPLQSTAAASADQPQPGAAVARLQQLLLRPELVASSTAPTAPLLTADNTLVKLHTSTEDTIAAMERLIAAAQHEILLQIYEYDDEDEAAARVFAALQQRVRRAVAGGQPLAVGIVVGRAWPSEHTLQQRDIESLVHELQDQGHRAAQVTVVLSRYRGSLFSILHTKTLTIDARDALVMTGNLITHGGIAVDSRNMAAHLRGPVLAALRADWAAAFALSHASAKTGPEQATLGTRAIELPAGPDRAVYPSHLHAAVLSRPSRWAPWSDPTPSLHAEGIVQLLRTAQNSIALVNPSIGADGVRAALLDAILTRGVQVTAVLSRHMNADREHYLFGGNNAEQAFKLYTQLLAQGGPEAAQKLTILWGSEDGRTPGATRSSGNIHAKVTAIDDDCLMVGSTNFNWLSFNTSRELTVALMGTGVTDGFTGGIFAQLVAKGVPMTAQDVPECQAGRRAHATCQFLSQRR